MDLTHAMPGSRLRTGPRDGYSCMSADSSCQLQLGNLCNLIQTKYEQHITKIINNSTLRLRRIRRHAADADSGSGSVCQDRSLLDCCWKGARTYQIYASLVTHNARLSDASMWLRCAQQLRSAAARWPVCADLHRPSTCDDREPCVGSRRAPSPVPLACGSGSSVLWAIGTCAR